MLAEIHEQFNVLLCNKVLLALLAALLTRSFAMHYRSQTLHTMLCGTVQQLLWARMKANTSFF
jgi:hypothetical protein